LFASDRERLTRKSGREDVNVSAPRSWSKRFEITPNRRLIQGTVLHTRCQNRGGKNFDLHVAETLSIWKNSTDGKIESSDAGTEGEHGWSGRCIHNGVCHPSESWRFVHWTDDAHGGRCVHPRGIVLACVALAAMPLSKNRWKESSDFTSVRIDATNP
jgi:hypothetical protein